MTRVLLLVLGLALGVSTSVLARTWYVKQDGTGHAITIRAGIDLAAEGDTVLLANGVYSGPDNRAMQFPAYSITIRSEGGDPRYCVIDCESSHRAFAFGSASDLHYHSNLEGVTISRGNCPRGGGVYCYWWSSPTIRNCIFSDCVADEGGAFWADEGTRPRFISCVFTRNQARFGGALWLRGSEVAIDNCTFQGNQSGQGAAIHCAYDSETNMTDTIIAFNQGQAVYVDWEGHFRNALIICCDFYGNSLGDWTDGIADHYGIDGNFSADPLFCHVSVDDLSLCEISPCATGSCGLLGALGVGCSCGVATEPTSWGAIKSMYR